LLSFVLLGFIFYGTTVEAAHKHANLIEASGSARGLAVSGDDSGGNLNSRLAGCDDCLICQLHQHFAATLIATRDCDAPKVGRTGGFAPTVVILSSRSDAPRTGRAPPQTIQ
jgi:hypothetical protein